MWRSDLQFHDVRDRCFISDTQGREGTFSCQGHLRRSRSIPIPLWTGGVAAGPPVDWIGSWIITASRPTWPVLCRGCQPDGLFDDRYILLTVSLLDHRPDAVAYGIVEDKEVETLLASSWPTVRPC